MELAKGTKEYFGKEQEKREFLIETLVELFRIYGYKPLETPILQRWETLTKKYGGGEEITKEIFKLKDQGNRDLALRFDLTVPLARFVAANPELRFPLKRYEYGRVFRDGPIKKGRLREFLQCDVDIIGSSSILCEVELLDLVIDFFDKIGIEIEIELNDVNLLYNIIKKVANIEDEETIKSFMLSIDKLKKIGEEGVIKELKEKGLEEERAKELVKTLLKPISEIAKSENEIKKSMKQLENIKKLVKKPAVVKITPSLARGLNYYTSTIFEVFVKSKKYQNSVAGGGRYDNLIGLYTKNKEVLPAVGISFGVDSIIAALSEMNIEGKIKEIGEKRKGVFIKPLYSENENEKSEIMEEAVKILRELRENRIISNIELSERSLKAALRYCDAELYRYCIIIGKNEIKNEVVTLKDLETGEEKKVNRNELIKYLQ